MPSSFWVSALNRRMNMFHKLVSLTLYGPGFWAAPQDRGADSVPPQYLGLYLSVANKTWQIYKGNQNKVIDIKKIMLALQNVADVIKNQRGYPKILEFPIFLSKIVKMLKYVSNFFKTLNKTSKVDFLSFNKFLRGLHRSLDV